MMQNMGVLLSNVKKTSNNRDVKRQLSWLEMTEKQRNNLKNANLKTINKSTPT